MEYQQHPLLYFNESDIESLTTESLLKIVHAYIQESSNEFGEFITEDEAKLFFKILDILKIFPPEENFERHNIVHVQKVKRTSRRLNSYKKDAKRMQEVDEYPHLFCVGPYVSETTKGKYLKYPKSSKTKKFYKRVSNKKMRNSLDGYNTSQKGHYRKRFDYKWQIS